MVLKTTLLALLVAASGLVASTFWLLRPKPAVRGCELARVQSPEREAPGTQELEGLQELKGLKERIAALERKTEAIDELDVWQEAARLGVVREIARSRTGLLPGQEHRLAVAIVREARRNDIDPLLVTALIRVESSFDSFAVSRVGAVGLMQILPQTGQSLARQRSEPLPTARSLYDQERNVALGCAYLAELVRRFKNLDAALLAYNMGPGAARALLERGEAALPALDGYPRKVLAEYARISQASGLRDASRPSGLSAPRDPRAEGRRG